ncbi:MAG: hypothetical protein EBT00_15370 [Proteobacteria bacterium]|jgi:hypothetical protein|nr:hypothetical protein [Pseudomonadota bacterium]
MTDFRALCAELVDAIGSLVGGVNCGHYKQKDMWKCREIFDRARAALSQPEPQGPTLAEVDDLCAEHSFVYDGGDEGLECVHALIVDALALWGNQ